jgi:hypothetical protein
MGGEALYFAYGSNMHVGRLVGRLAFAWPVETAVLRDHEMRFHKRGRDGSAKCSIVSETGSEVVGVLYRIRTASLERLDRVEGSGYRRAPVAVIGLRSGRRYRAHWYAAKSGAVDETRIAYEWYRDIVVAGAEAHGLPLAYLERLRATPARPDPNRRRHRRHAALLAPPRGGGRRRRHYGYVQ